MPGFRIVIFASLLVMDVSFTTMVVNRTTLTHPDRKLRTPRPRRGSPEQTRERLVAAAASLFNRVGYHGTDSNRIAEEAGYSTGTFYKHFKDKREIFLAAYEAWVSSEWKAVAAELSSGTNPETIARQLVMLSIEFHTRWRGLRASLLELVFADAEVRRFYRRQRRRQLDVMGELRARTGAPPRRREDDAIHLFTTERTFDALAQGELQDLDLDREVVIEAMIQRVLSMLV
jgi:AcrR family transcriptional regulator